MTRTCTNCGSTNLRWGLSKANNSAVMDGRLRMHDISILAYLACEECSEVLQYLAQSEAENLLNDGLPGLPSEQDSAYRGVKVKDLRPEMRVTNIRGVDGVCEIVSAERMSGSDVVYRVKMHREDTGGIIEPNFERKYVADQHLCVLQ